jgi:hypothetical protein
VRARFLAWTLGSILFAHVMNFFSISLFDQSVAFFYVVLGGIDAVAAARGSASGPAGRAGREAAGDPRAGTKDARSVFAAGWRA